MTLGDEAALLLLTPFVESDAPMISFVFPAFNESENLRRFSAEVLPVFESLHQPFEIVIVDDGSTDQTAAVAEAMGGPVRLVKHPRNLGLGAAIKTGLQAARGELIITLDTDLTFAPELVKPMLAALASTNADVVAGSPKLAGFSPDIPVFRVWMSELATLLYSIALGQHVTAVSPILRLYKREDVQALNLDTAGFDINAEILFKLIQRGKKVVEVPAPLTQRIHGESKLDYAKETRRHLKLLTRMFRWRIKKLVGRAP